MFSFPLLYFLLAYLLFLLIFIIFSLANVYHIYSTGTFTFPAVLVTLVVTIWSIIILTATYTVANGINWQTQAVFFGSGGLLTFGI